MQVLDQLAHQIGFAHPGHAPQVDDHRTFEQLRHQVPHLDAVHQLVDDFVDTHKILFEGGFSGFKFRFTGLDVGFCQFLA